MESFEQNKYETFSHAENLDYIFNNEVNNFENIESSNIDVGYISKVYFRFLRKKFISLFSNKPQKSFTNIIYLTSECPPFTQKNISEDSPLEYILQMQKQYPNKNIRIMVPIIGLNYEEVCKTKNISVDINGKSCILEKTSVNFNYFAQNKQWRACLYKFPKNNTNIQVYGLYSPCFSFCSDENIVTRIKFLAPWMRASRIAIRKLKTSKNEQFKPDIVHCENIPFYLGSEFELKLPYPVKVIQSVKDFTQFNTYTIEPFWAAINLADKNVMRKICNDNVIKKNIAMLFKLHNSRNFYKINDCLKFIFKNYPKFRKYIDQGDAIEENAIFRKLNARILQILPELNFEGQSYYNMMAYSIKRASFWTTTSKTYYSEIFENQNIAGNMQKLINKTKAKSSYFEYAADVSKYTMNTPDDIFYDFNSENFRENRIKNKFALLRELSLDKIKLNLPNPTTFPDKNVKIYGHLDSFYDSPILFANPENEIFSNGIDILFNSILKLFERYKNIRVIICIKDGMKANFIKKWIEFLTENKHLNGRWIFIDGQINKSKFYAASDMTLIPRRANIINSEHIIAMRYGCVPIASGCGILNDDIPDIFEDISNGCGFKTKSGFMINEDCTENFMNILTKAIGIYQNNPSGWKLLIKNCLLHQSGWSFKILERYNRIYEELA